MNTPRPVTPAAPAPLPVAIEQTSNAARHVPRQPATDNSVARTYGATLASAFTQNTRLSGPAANTAPVRGQLLLTLCDDALRLRRSMAHVATDSRRDYVFQVFSHGGVEAIEGIGFERRGAALATIVALDMSQPISLERTACAALTFSAPRKLVEATLPHAEALHGQVLEPGATASQRLMEHVRALSIALPTLSSAQAANAFENGLRALLAAFGRQALVYGNSRAAGRSQMFGDARRYVQTNLHQPWLSPERLMKALQLPRATLYRLFEHEGGLACYIRTCRLREAGDQLVRHPDRQVTEIAYGLGFNSASDFTRAFRRGHGMSPQDHRQTALQYLRERRNEDWLIERITRTP